MKVYISGKKQKRGYDYTFKDGIISFKKPFVMKKLRNVKDGQRFIFRNVGTIYSMQRKEKGKAIYTSEWSGRTFVSDWNRKVFKTV